MKDLYADFKEVLRRPRYFLSFLILFFLIFSIFRYFTNEALIVANLGKTYYNIEMISLLFIALLSSSFIVLSTYKINYFKKFSKKDASVGGLGAFLGILVVGCPACSITLASYIGLAGIFTAMPFFGLEMKLISIPLLLYANYSVLNSLKTCKIESKKKKK